MIPNNYKTSLLIPSQLPQFIRDDPNTYGKFVAFLQAYYEWLEQTGNVTDATKNLLNYDDVDSTTNDFLNYFCNDFMSYFPPESTWATTNKSEVIKIAKQLYQSKGTPASFKFLFRVLYNTDVDFFFTKDAVLKASSGKWYVPRSLKLDTLDLNFLSINNLRLFGQTTKSIATVENAIIAGNKTEVFISNIERLFQSGEFVTVVDSNNQIVYFLNNEIVPSGTPGAETLSAKIVGQIGQITLSKDAYGNVLGGTKYQQHDPVVVYNGINANTVNPLIATAEVGSTTLGSIQRIDTINGGFGYTDANTANVDYTTISITQAGSTQPPLAHVGGLDSSPNGIAHVTNLPIDYINDRAGVLIGNTSHLIQYGFSANLIANYNTTLANAFTFVSFDTYPISSVVVDFSGAGVSQTPPVLAKSTYRTGNTAYQADLKSLGILAPIQIVNGGSGYQVNDKINFLGGRGYGAFANVVSVNSTGSITSVGYTYQSNTTHNYPLGGMGYKTTSIPILTVTSANNLASNASLYVPGVLGDGAVFSVQTNQVGVINSIIVTNPGEDYTFAPNVSLRVQDIVITGLDPNNSPKSGDIIYQGANANVATYTSTVYSINEVIPYANTEQSVYVMRVYNYNQSVINYNLPLVNDPKGISLSLSTQYSFSDTRYQPAITPGVLTYGQGDAQATATFLNGLIIGQGQYLDTTGQPSGFDVLQSLDYNNFTYEITLEKEIAKYRNILLNLLHPTGMKVLGRFAMVSNSSYNSTAIDALSSGYSLYHYTGAPASNAIMYGSFTNPSNNIINFTNLSGANLENIILNNSTISFTTTDGDYVHSEVVSICDGSSNTVVIKDNVWLSFANVAYVNAMSGSNVINITSLTNSYDVINNGQYTNPDIPLIDIVRVGDTILVPNNSIKTVTNIDYGNSILYVSSNLANTVSNGFLSVTRTMVANASSVLIFGPVGVQYFPELTDENGNSLETEDGNIIILG
jgi:hypothetical protein